MHNVCETIGYGAMLRILSRMRKDLREKCLLSFLRYKEGDAHTFDARTILNIGLNSDIKYGFYLPTRDKIYEELDEANK